MNTAAAVRESKAIGGVSILGVPFDAVTIRETVARVEQMIASGEPHYLATANVDFVVQAQRDIELRRILLNAHLVLCDGTPLIWASRWLGNPLPERVAGADVVPELIRVAAEKGYGIFLLGATPEAAQRAVDRLQHQHPALRIVGHYSPGFQPLLKMDHEEICRRIREAKPDLLFVSFGCPKQEKWIAMHYRSLGVPVAIGVGATIDFLGGLMKRAPLWMQHSGTEWLFRLAQEPRRLFKRYALDLAVFGSRFCCQWWHLGKWRSKHSNPTQSCAATLRTNGWQHLELPGRFNAESVQESAPVLSQVQRDSRSCVLDGRQVRFIDSAGVAALMRLQRDMQSRGRLLILLAPSRVLRRTLSFMKVEAFFRIAEDLQSARRLERATEQERAIPVTGLNPVIWQGEITVANASEVLSATQRKLLATRVSQLEIDASRVRFVDSTGAEMMSKVKALAERSGVELRFTALPAAVRNVLGFCRLEELASGPSVHRIPAIPVRGGQGLVLSRQTQG